MAPHATALQLAKTSPAMSPAPPRDDDAGEPGAQCVRPAPVPAPAAPPEIDPAAFGIEPCRQLGGAPKDGLIYTPEACKRRLGPMDAFGYARHHEAALLAALRAGTQACAAAHPGVPWIAGGLSRELHVALAAGCGGHRLHLALPELLAPVAPWPIIDRYRRTSGAGPLESWVPEIGAVLGAAFARQLAASLARMVPRYAAQRAQLHQRAVAPADLVAGHPLDRVTAQLLCDPRVVAAAAPLAVTAAGGAEAFQGGARYLAAWTWLGSEDATLWNWIRVTEPADATAEEVATTLFLGPTGAPQSQLAHELIAAPPYFAIPPARARKFAEARAHEPRDAGNTNTEGATALARSSLATEAAVAQAPVMHQARGANPTGRAADRALAASTAQQLADTARRLARAEAALAPWKLAGTLEPAVRWTERLRDAITGVPAARLVQLARVVRGQSEVVFAATGEVVEVVDGAEVEPTGPRAAALRHYAIALGESHLSATARRELGLARAARRELPFALLSRRLASGTEAVRDLARINPGAAAAAMRDHAVDAGALAALEVAHARGELRGEQLATVAADIEYHAVEARTRALVSQIRAVRDQLRAASSGVIGSIANAFASAPHRLPPQLDTIVGRIDEVLAQLPIDRARVSHDVPRADDSAHVGERAAQATQAAVARANERLREIDEQHQIGERCRAAAEAVGDARWRTMLLEVVAMIAVSAVSMGVGGAAGGAARGAMLSRASLASGGALRTARVVGAATEFVVDAGLSTAGQTLIGGGDFASQFGVNLLSNAAVLAALRPLQRLAAQWQVGALDAGGSAWARVGRTAQVGLRATAVISAEMITAAAVDYAAKRALLGPPPSDETAAQWALTGASMVVGRWVTGRLTGLHQRLGAHAELAALGALRQRAERAVARARALEQRGDPAAALDLMAEDHALHQRVAEELERLPTLPGARLAPASLANLRADHARAQRELGTAAHRELQLRLAGLAPDDASGRLWVGTPEAVAVALHQVSRVGGSVEVRAHDPAARRWTVQIGGRAIEIWEQPRTGQPRAARGRSTPAQQAEARRYAEAAAFLQQKWEENTAREITATRAPEYDHVQIGMGIAGVQNQATLAESGPGLGRRLAVYEHSGALTNGGVQPLGQRPAAWDASGLRATEQAGSPDRWLASTDLARTIAVGKLEVQTPAYRGKVTAVERRSASSSQADWLVPARGWRVRIEPAGKWVYTDRIDDASGLGGGTLSAVRGIAGADFDALVRSGRVLVGDDRDLARKLDGASSVAVWGGSPTGAWAAQAARGQVSLIGDDPTQPAAMRLRGYREQRAEVDAALARAPRDAAALARKAELDAWWSRAHSGAALARNRGPGAAYAGDDPRIQTSIGTPKKLRALPDGRLELTINEGGRVRVEIHDRMVVAHGQRFDGPDGPASLLGPPAADESQEVPAGTLALRPVLSSAGTLLAVESLDGSYRRVGAAAATRALARWIRLADRQRFVAALDAGTAAGTPTRHGAISPDSHRVAAGIEHQRDAIPRANEALAARAYHLPGLARNLELDFARPVEPQLHAFFVASLRADPRFVRITRVDAGAESQAFRIDLGEHTLGVLRVAADLPEAKREHAMLETVRAAKIKGLGAAEARGMVSVNQRGAARGAVLTTPPSDPSLQRLVAEVGLDPATRRERVQRLQSALVRTAAGLRDMRAHFGSQGLMTDQAKRDQVALVINPNFSGDAAHRVRASLGRDFERIRQQVEGPVRDAFIMARISSSASVGAGADGYTVGEATVSIATASNAEHRNRAAGEDLGRLLGSLGPANLDRDEYTGIEHAVTRAYFVRGAAPHDELAATTLYRAAAELDAAARGDITARARLVRLLGLEQVP